ncbi:MAG: Ig-like domain-containing protein [Methylococcaceae bacterium]|nr:Ig-like domain-containing protein [Methylococcaceae bacterium]
MKSVNEVNNTNIDTMTEINKMNHNTITRREGSARLRRSIQIALASSMLVSTMVGAVLRDHGPSNRVVGFPDWYRDFNGLALGQCIYADDAGNGPLCLTGPADANPDGFAGNLGDEAFFATADIDIPITGGAFLWMGHLEMAYGSASGSPPAIRDLNNPTEIVFSRERIRIDLPATGNDSCSGHYTIRTPYKVHEFDLVEGARALFYTDDIQPIMGDYAAALKGHAGPFLQWDKGADGVNPVSVDNPAVTVLPPVGPARKYIGDPNQPHTFTGSTVAAGPGHEDKINNNYVEIIPPAACDLGSGAGVPLFEENAAISGLIWDLPIATPTTITKATYTRNNSTAALDVWAESAPNQNLVVTAADNSTQHLPSVTLKEETIGGNHTGIYHAHIEFNKDQNIPSQVSVANLSSTPVARDAAAVVDAVVVTKSVYDPVSKMLCIAAHSGDETSPNPLNLVAPAYGSFVVPTTTTCAGVAPNDLVLEKNLNDFNPDNRIPPTGILVQSSKGGSENSQPVIGTGITDATVHTQAVDDSFTGVPGSGTTSLNLVSGAFAATEPSTVAKTEGLDTPPVNPYRIVVVSQPEIGTVTAPASDGTVTYQAVEAMPTSIQSFYYAIQDTTDLSVSNVAKVDLSVNQVIPPPVGVADRQGVFRTSLGSIIKVLSNDVTGLTSTAIDPTSVQIAAQGTRGTATANSDGTVTYVPNGQAGAANNTQDSFTYTVANVAGSRSAPITVQVVLKSAAEAVAFQRVRYNGTWNIRFTSTYAGAAGAVTLAPVATCEVSANPGAPTRVGVIGTASPGAGTNAYVIGGANPAPSGNNWTVRCTTTSGGTASRTGTL